jgi:pimeloyl-ACP methyl ester carboxylesterase
MAKVPPARYEGSIRLPDGRRLGFAEFGVPDGRPVLWFHGTPGARNQIPLVARVSAEDLGLRLVCLERPGVGSSTPHSYPGLLDWAGDVGRVADRLGIERYGLVGLSGGGPYALACASHDPDRVVAAALLGGVVPARGDEAAPGGLVQLAALAGPVIPALTAPMSGALWLGMRAAQPFGPRLLDLYARFSPPGDRAVLATQEIKDMFLDDLTRGSRRRFRAVLDDLRLFSRPWGFSVADIAVPMHVWHGDADPIVPLAHAEHLVSLLPRAELRVRVGESHLGNFAAAGEILSALVADWEVGATG